MIAVTEQRNKIHPHKLLMWLAMGSMFMVFAGLTSAFILQKAAPVGLSNDGPLQQNNPGWFYFNLPLAFWFSTFFILLSSYTMHKAVATFKARLMGDYKKWIGTTLFLGFIFIGLQIIGFYNLYQQNITLITSSSSGFLFIISGLHMAHIAGAIIALLIVYLTAFRKTKKIYNSISIEVMAIFWHFVDVLWVYLFIFFLLNFKL